MSDWENLARDFNRSFEQASKALIAFLLSADAHFPPPSIGYWSQRQVHIVKPKKTRAQRKAHRKERQKARRV